MNAPLVMILRGTALGTRTRYDGQFLEAFDFEAHNGRGEITMTTDVQKAMKFDDLHAAMAFYKTQPKCRPIRGDGKPNRPLTASNWEMCSVDQALKGARS